MFELATAASAPTMTAWLPVARSYQEEGDHDRAMADYTEAIRLNPNDAAAFYNRGIARVEKGEYDLAIADFSEAIRLDPDVAKAFFSRGVAYYAKGEHDRAIADYDEAIRLDPTFGAAIR